MNSRVAIVLCMSMLFVSCDPTSNLDAPRKFFDGHKIGTSPDYGVIKWNDKSDHVISVHGFGDDLAACQIVADAFNADACAETGGEGCLNPFSCIPLNH